VEYLRHIGSIQLVLERVLTYERGRLLRKFFWVELEVLEYLMLTY
jgi:hypothetical protein